MGIDHEISFACEIDKYARQTYLANFKPKMMLEDMTKESWEGDEFYSDLFIGGIPCQSFSIAGKRLGELDPRGLLFYDFYRYVKLQQPKVFLLENVKGLLSDNKGITFLKWKDLLGRSINYQEHLFQNPDSLEYNLHFTVLNTKDFGLPQNRERVFLVGIRNDLPNDFSFPSGWELDLRLKDILEENVDDKYYLSDKMIEWISIHREKRDSKNKFPLSKNDVTGALTARFYKMGAEDIYIQDYVCLAMSGLNPRDSQLQILKTNSRGITNLDTDPKKSVFYKNRIRRLTPLECFRLQGFPDSFIKPVSNSQLYKQAGNTISVPVIQAIIKNLLHLLK